MKERSLIQSRPASAHPVLDRLRVATGDAHRRLELRLDVVEALSCPARRPELVERYRRFHRDAAILLRGGANGVRRSWLDAGDDGGRPEAGAEPFAPVDGPEAAGFRYVIEGSALGGKVIARTLAARGVDTRGLEFLDPCGADAGPSWRGFLLVLERSVVGERALAAAVAGAEKGFGFAELALCGTAGGTAAGGTAAREPWA